MSQIDSVGAFLGDIVESGLTLSKKSGYPQWVARIKATKKYVTEASELAHFKLTEPAWVDWNFDEDTLAYMVLFKSATSFDAESKLLNYEQLQLATGWDGSSFDALSDGTFIGKTILFRVEENNYEGKTSLQVNWIDAADAAPERQLKTLDLSEVKKLSALLTITKTKAPAKPVAAVPATAKPVGRPPKAPVGTPTTAATPAAPVATPDAAAPVATATTAPKSTPPKRKAAAIPPPPPVTDAIPGLPAETTQNDAWEFIQAHKGDNEDSVVQEAWMAACGEAAPGQADDSQFTPAIWARVRDLVIKDLALTI